jgi:hypothetical protein
MKKTAVVGAIGAALLCVGVAFDVEGVERITPVVIDVCKKSPKEIFWQKVRSNA